MSGIAWIPLLARTMMLVRTEYPKHGSFRRHERRFPTISTPGAKFPGFQSPARSPRFPVSGAQSPVPSPRFSVL